MIYIILLFSTEKYKNCTAGFSNKNDMILKCHRIHSFIDFFLKLILNFRIFGQNTMVKYALTQSWKLSNNFYENKFSFINTKREFHQSYGPHIRPNVLAIW